MRTWLRVTLLPLSFGALACPSDADGESGTDGSSSGSTSEDPTTDPTNSTSPTTTPTTDDSTSSSSSGDPTDSTTGGSSSSEGSGETTAEGSSSSGGSSSTGPGVSAYEGSYAGPFEGLCGKVEVSGIISFDVDAEGVAAGAFMGNDDGMLEGTVDAEGAIELAGDGDVAGPCEWPGQFDDMTAATGTWTCPDFECVGTWEATEVMK